MGRSNELKQAKSDYKWALGVLATLFAVPTIVSIIQHGFHFELIWGFEQLIVFYRSMMTPVIDIVQSQLLELMAFLQLNWRVPQWVKDLHVLSFVFAGIYVRGWGDQFEMSANAMRAMRRGPFDPSDPLHLSHGCIPWQTCVGLLLGFSGLGLLAPLAAFASFVRVLTLQDRGHEELLRRLNKRVRWPIVLGMSPRETAAVALLLRSRDPDAIASGDLPSTLIGQDWARLFHHAIQIESIATRFRFLSLLRVLAATGSAVIAFYVINAIAPQFGFR